MNKNIDSCSDVQQKYERIVFERVEEWLGVKLQSNPKVYFDKVHIEPDFYTPPYASQNPRNRSLP